MPINWTKDLEKEHERLWNRSTSTTREITQLTGLTIGQVVRRAQTKGWSPRPSYNLRARREREDARKAEGERPVIDLGDEPKIDLPLSPESPALPESQPSSGVPQEAPQVEAPVASEPPIAAESSSAADVSFTDVNVDLPTFDRLWNRTPMLVRRIADFFNITESDVEEIAKRYNLLPRPSFERRVELEQVDAAGGDPWIPASNQPPLDTLTELPEQCICRLIHVHTREERDCGKSTFHNSPFCPEHTVFMREREKARRSNPLDP